jgi:hypothetical protein
MAMKTFAPLPAWLLAIAAAPPPLAEPVREVIPMGERDKTLASLAGTLRRRGLDAEEILPTLMVVNARRCVPPLPDGDLARIARSIARKPAGRPLVDRRAA